MKPIRHRRYAVLPLVFLALTVLMRPDDAQASGAHLDTGFGTAGIAVLPRQFGKEFIGAGLLPGGRVVVANHKEALALLPTGRVDPSFGQAGNATFLVPEGFAQTYVYGFGVDAEGRTVVVGETGIEGPEPVEKVFVERLTTDGAPDPTFADRGYVVGGIPLPPGEAGTPVVGLARGVGFDSEGRILISGSTEVGNMITRNGTESRFEGFLARLEASGALDRSFGAEGVYLGPGDDFAVVPGNRLILGESAAESVFSLDQNGVLDRSFGKNGHVPYPSGVADGSFQVDPRGRTVIWRRLEPVKGKHPAGIVIRRLRANGSLDRSFGDHGIVRRRISSSRQIELGFDEQGRILLKVTLTGGGEAGVGKELSLIRLRQDGRRDRSFGEHGSVRIPFPGRPDVYVGESEGEGIVVKGDQALVRAVSCGSRRGCRPVVSLVDLGSN